MPKEYFLSVAHNGSLYLNNVDIIETIRPTIPAKATVAAASEPSTIKAIDAAMALKTLTSVRLRSPERSKAIVLDKKSVTPIPSDSPAIIGVRVKLI